MTPYQIIWTTIAAIALTVLLILITRYNAKREIAKREEFYKKMRNVPFASAIGAMNIPDPKQRKRRLETERIRRKYPTYPQDSTRRRTEDDYVGPVMYPIDFDGSPQHHDHCDPTPDSHHGSSDSWSDSSSSDSSSSDSGGGDSGGGDGGGGD